MPRRATRLHRSVSPALLSSALLALAACGGGAGGSGTTASPAVTPATDAEWRSLALPRPEPLPEAPRVALDAFEIEGTTPWAPPAGMTRSLAVGELVATGLLRRQDVHFVERRRFAAAAERERRGEPRPAGAPAAGVSPGARYTARASWSHYGAGASLDVRVLETQTGAVVAAWRAPTPTDADPVSLARLSVGGILAALDDLGVRPTWQDPVPGAATTVWAPSGVPGEAAAAFFQGLAAEEAWRWEPARVGYQRAVSEGGNGFPEAAAALARTARLRNGGTLGSS